MPTSPHSNKPSTHQSKLAEARATTFALTLQTALTVPLMPLVVGALTLDNVFLEIVLDLGLMESAKTGDTPSPRQNLAD
jgi:hypothetical protein